MKIQMGLWQRRKKSHNICGMIAGGIWGGQKETSKRWEWDDIRGVNENKG